MLKHYHLRYSRLGIFGLYVFVAYNTFRSGRWWRVVHLLRNILLETFFKRVAKCVFDFLCLWYAVLLKCLLHKCITNFKFWFDFNQSAKINGINFNYRCHLLFFLLEYLKTTSPVNSSFNSLRLCDRIPSEVPTSENPFPSMRLVYNSSSYRTRLCQRLGHFG